MHSLGISPRIIAGFFEDESRFFLLRNGIDTFFSFGESLHRSDGRLDGWKILVEVSVIGQISFVEADWSGISGKTTPPMTADDVLLSMSIKTHNLVVS